MTRLIVHAEGPTEEAFVNEVLSQHLYHLGYTDVSARIIGKKRQRARRGGIVPWQIARQGILNHLTRDQGLHVSTLVDYYALPHDWPGLNDAPSAPTISDKAQAIEDALLDDVSVAMGTSFNPNRFVPFVMMHEFEAMLFSDCPTFATAIGQSDLSPSLQAIRDNFASPEEIDDSPDTAPSKRIEALHPAYQKPTMGLLAAQSIGLQAIRNECPHFAAWLHRLETLP
ncbi:MAG: DUF4276 family protein [Chloroflexi bacterium]|nr:DUF4276 family protein [Chloroflexota bacterium]